MSGEEREQQYRERCWAMRFEMLASSKQAEEIEKLLFTCFWETINKVIQHWKCEEKRVKSSQTDIPFLDEELWDERRNNYIFSCPYGSSHTLFILFELTLLLTPFLALQCPFNAPSLSFFLSLFPLISFLSLSLFSVCFYLTLAFSYSLVIFLLPLDLCKEILSRGWRRGGSRTLEPIYGSRTNKTLILNSLLYCGKPYFQTFLMQKNKKGNEAYSKRKSWCEVDNAPRRLLNSTSEVLHGVKVL